MTAKTAIAKTIADLFPATPAGTAIQKYSKIKAVINESNLVVCYNGKDYGLKVDGYATYNNDFLKIDCRFVSATGKQIEKKLTLDQLFAFKLSSQPVPTTQPATQPATQPQPVAATPQPATPQPASSLSQLIGLTCLLLDQLNDLSDAKFKPSEGLSLALESILNAAIVVIKESQPVPTTQPATQPATQPQPVAATPQPQPEYQKTIREAHKESSEWKTKVGFKIDRLEDGYRLTLKGTEHLVKKSDLDRPLSDFLASGKAKKSTGSVTSNSNSDKIKKDRAIFLYRQLGGQKLNEAVAQSLRQQWNEKGFGETFPDNTGVRNATAQVIAVGELLQKVEGSSSLKYADLMSIIKRVTRNTRNNGGTVDPNVEKVERVAHQKGILKGDF